MDADQLVAALREAIDEDERLALAATPGPWLSDPTGTVVAEADVRPDGKGGEILPEGGPMEVAECYRNERADERGSNAEHIARHDPARVLRQVAAHRKILDNWQRLADVNSSEPGDIGERAAYWRMVQALAEVYGIQDSTEGDGS